MIKFTPIGAKVYVETDIKKFSVDPEEVDFEVLDSTHIAFSVAGGISVELSDITLDGETPSDLDDFLEKFAAVFPDAGGAAGPTPGIDDVLAVGQALTTDREIDGTGFNLTYKANLHTFIGGEGDAFLIKTPNYSSGFLKVADAGEGGGALYLGDSDGEGNGTRLYLDDNEQFIKAWAASHEWYVGGDEVFKIDAAGVTIESLAGGGITGLSIDNDGKIIRTP